VVKGGSFDEEEVPGERFLASSGELCPAPGFCITFSAVVMASSSFLTWFRFRSEKIAVNTILASTKCQI
jgi:hypothetical protein